MNQRRNRPNEFAKMKKYAKHAIGNRTPQTKSKDICSPKCRYRFGCRGEKQSSYCPQRGFRRRNYPNSKAGIFEAKLKAEVNSPE